MGTSIPSGRGKSAWLVDTDAKGMPLSLVRRTLQLQEKTVVRAMPSMMGTLVPTASMWGSRLNGTERPGSDEP